jgi:hypothetical protein
VLDLVDFGARAQFWRAVEAFQFTH